MAQGESASPGLAPGATRSGADASGAAGAGILGAAEASGQFTKLLAAIELAGLRETLESAGPFTVFAPTDAAFEAMAPGMLDQLMKPEYRPQLRTVLLYHVLSGRQDAAALSQTTGDVRATNGLTLQVDAKTPGKVKINEANVIQKDVKASNGVIHVIDTVLIPTAKSQTPGNAG
jgi:uncharacterized surface protein with fasciclin (FAS1) repeats